MQQAGITHSYCWLLEEGGDDDMALFAVKHLPGTTYVRTYYYPIMVQYRCKQANPFLQTDRHDTVPLTTYIVTWEVPAVCASWVLIVHLTGSTKQTVRSTVFMRRDDWDVPYNPQD